MARALLLALACASALAAAAGARFGDYTGAKMPQYGAVDYDARAAAPPADDYHDHSPDAPAPLDYKYEEVSSDKIEKPILNDVEEDDSWKKPVKKLRNEKSVDHDDPEALNKYKLDEVVPKFQTKYRGKNTPRYRNRNKVRTEEVLSRRVSPGREDLHRHVDDEETQLHPEDFREDNNLEPEEEKSKSVRREIRPKVRRKPRDRPNLNAILKSGNEEEENISDLRDIPKSLRGGHEYPDIEERPLVHEDADQRPFKGRVQSGEEEDDELVAPVPGRKQKLIKNYNDYADYYDMKRVQNIKKKVPAVRRTQARGMAPPGPRRFIASRRTRRPFQRRKNYPSDIDVEPDAAASPTIKAVPTRHTAYASVSIESDNAKILQEMSLAEKSRLSIMKKAQRKESSRNGTSTDKPPVLLQVTQKLHTVVIVEPPPRNDPWMRAREVSDDSPARLKKVKKLMRHKLVANAKDIRDLTENWNDVVCDYVDVGMLDTSTAFTHTLKADNLFLLTIPALHLIFSHL